MDPNINSNVQNHVPGKFDIKGELVPLRDFVYVEPEIIKDRMTESGIYLKQPGKQGVPNTGWIRFLGPDVKNTELEVGDKVVVTDPNMRGVHVNGVAIVPLQEDKVIAKIKE
jgi:co-chaperonin GroES (HSP10)